MKGGTVDRHYLVLLRCSIDDIPMGIHSSMGDARKRALMISPRDQHRVSEVFSIDLSTPICVAVVTFENGLPVKLDIVREIEKIDPKLEKAVRQAAASVGCNPNSPGPVPPDGPYKKRKKEKRR